MATVPNLAGGTPVDRKYASVNRFMPAASILSATPLYAGEQIVASDTGVRYEGIALVPGGWGRTGQAVSGLAVSVTRAAGQSSPVNAGPINFTAMFSRPVTGFTNADLTFTGSTVGGTLAGAITGTGPYNIAVTGMTGVGDVVVGIVASSGTDPDGKIFPASNTASVVFDSVALAVTINKASGQADPTNNEPINYTVTFNKPVTGFDASDISFAGSTVGGALSAIVTGSNPYNVAVSGMGTASGAPIALVKSATGTNTIGTVTPGFGSPTTAGNLIVLAICGDAAVPSPGTGWTQSTGMGQVGNNGGYLWWRISAGETSFPSYTLSGAANSSWVITEFSGCTATPLDVSLGQVTTGGNIGYTTPTLTPTSGSRVLIAGMLGSSGSDLTGPFTAWLNSFIQAAAVGQSVGATKTCAGVGYRLVTGDGVTTFSSGANWPASCTGHVGLIISFKGTASAVVAGNVVASIPAGVVTDAVGGTNAASTSTDNVVAYDPTLVPSSIPMTYNDPIFASTTAGVNGTILTTGQSLIDKSFPVTNAGNASIVCQGANTVQRCRFGALGTPVREGPRVAGGGVMMFDQCYIEVDGLTAESDHADGIQAFSPGDTGTIFLNNTFIRAYRTGDGPIGEGSVGTFIADNWTGTFKCRNVVFQSGQFGCRAFPDVGGDMHIDFDTVYFVGPYAQAAFDIGQSIGGHVTVIDRWVNVRNATIVGGAIVPGSLIPSPI